jgi:hypothetical protein
VDGAKCARRHSRRPHATADLKEIVGLIEAYEAKRWPLGKDPDVQGGKGRAGDRWLHPEILSARHLREFVAFAFDKALIGAAMTREGRHLERCVAWAGHRRIDFTRRYFFSWGGGRGWRTSLARTDPSLRSARARALSRQLEAWGADTATTPGGKAPPVGQVTRHTVAVYAC